MCLDADGTGLTQSRAQLLHEQRQQADPEHDRGGCWCCCGDCDFDVEAILGAPAPGAPS